VYDLLKEPILQNELPVNVLYIDCHDLGDWLGCYGRPYLHTPHLDRLAAQGAVFDQYFAAAPICMPSRAATFTGCMPHQSGVHGQDPLDRSWPCLPEYFRRAGYETVLSGGLMIRNEPASVGFERVLAATSDAERAAAAASFLLDRSQSPEPGRPFYLSVSFSHVHRPYGPDYDPGIATAIPVPPPLPDVPIVRQDLATLARNVAELDDLVGTILDALDRTGVADDTLVVFTTEHGAAIARAKHTLYDAGLKIALLVRHPRAVPPSMRCADLLSNVDLLPTLLELCHLPPAPAIQGRSFSRQLTTATSSPRDAVFAEHSWGRRSGHYHYTPARCIRTARHKYIRNFTRQPPYIDNGWLSRFSASRRAVEEAASIFATPAPPEELYDLETDPHELHNLASDDAHQQLCANLSARLDAFLQQTEDPVLHCPLPNSDGAPDTPQWIERPDGSVTLAPSDPYVERERPIATVSSP
jgi:N-sulfoglucosamine sulfohydrolase